MVLRVTQYGEAVLRQAGAPVTRFDTALAQLARDMVETMYAAEGIGLAAQQVGHALQLCVVDTQQRPTDVDFHYLLDGKRPPIDLIMPMVLANPQISPVGTDLGVMEEGCLSFPGIRGEIKRPAAITVRYQDVQGNPHLLECNGLLARVIQHEVDHLNGVLFIDHFGNRMRKELDPEIKRLKQRSRAAFGKGPAAGNEASV